VRLEGQIANEIPVQLGIHDRRSTNELTAADLDSNAGFGCDLNVQLRIDGDAGFEHRLDAKRAGRLRVALEPQELLILVLDIFVLRPVNFGFAETDLGASVDLAV
jgi:hypothetical protein